jgi:hypothetical protein
MFGRSAQRASGAISADNVRTARSGIARGTATASNDQLAAEPLLSRELELFKMPG